MYDYYIVFPPVFAFVVMMSESIITCSGSAYYCKHTGYYVRAVAGEQP